MEKQMEFKVVVNPFKSEAIITSKIRGVEYKETVYWGYTDDWNSFTMDDKVFDVHFLYDSYFTVSIYHVEDNKVDYTKIYNVKLKIKLTD
jgi:hypothetical protein